jgi:hypothetical protein
VGRPHPTTKRGFPTVAIAFAVVVTILIPAGSAWSARGGAARVVPAGADTHSGPKGELDVNACPERPRPGTVTCFARQRIDSRAMSLMPAPAREAKLAGAKAPSGPTRGSTAGPVPSASTAATVGDNGAYSPAYLQSAYNAPSSNPGGTVAVVDAYDDPNAETDLASYRSYYGLPPCTTANGCFQKVDQRGGSSYPQPDNSWSMEMSIDLDMVSAICPNCHIVLVEADSNSWSDLNTAVNEAVNLGASAVSMSWGGFEYSGETTDNKYYDHPGVAMVASSGDGGYGPQFPASSPDVVSVGGTTLLQATSTGTRDATETVWSGSGGGCSQYMTKPSWQQDTGCRTRTMNDVSAVADPTTGVWVWDTYHGNGWGIFGGTSVSAPIIAALYALAGNASGSSTEMASTLYGASADGFNDVTSGFNGTCTNYLCNAGVGYDGPTGFGTPAGIAPFLLSSAPQPPADTTPPSVSFGSPASGETVSGTASVQVSASDNTAVADVTLAVDGSTVGTDTSSPWTFSVDTTRLTNGPHTLTATATDAAGNSSTAQESVTVQNATVTTGGDTKAPSTPSGLHLAVAGTTQAAIYWSPSSDNVGVTGYDVYRDGVLVAQTTLPNYLDTGLAPGSSHGYTIKAFDAAGNVSASSSKLNAKTVSLSTSTTSTVAGVVYGSTGKPLANVVVTLSGNGLTKTVKTSAAGVYKFSSLPAGTYTISYPSSTNSAAAVSTSSTSVTAVSGQTEVVTNS